jgi:hypothetical protein
LIHLNNYEKKNDNENNNYHRRLIATTATTISVLAIATIMLVSTSILTPVAATTTTAAGTNATTSSAPSGIKLSPEPIYQERTKEQGVTPINETHFILTYSGNGTLNLPNSTQTINTTSNGTVIISMPTSSGYAKETIRTETGDTAIATVYEIVQFNNNPTAAGGPGKGIVTAVFQTNSTGTLAPLNGLIAAGIDDMSSSIDKITFWRWESGIPPLSTNATTTSTATSETNVTTAAGTTDGGEE